MPSHTKAAAAVRKEIEHLKEYVARETSGSGLLSFHQAKLVAYGRGEVSLGQATVGLSYLASLRAAQGSLAVIDGDDSGWSSVNTYGLYGYWILRVLAAAYARDERSARKPRTTFDRFAMCWMHARASSATEPLEWLTRQAKIAHEGETAFGRRSLNPLCCLVGWYCTGESPEELKRAGWGSLGPYEEVALGRIEPATFDLLSDYHLQRTKGSGFPEFAAFPYRVFPAELIAIGAASGVHNSGSVHPLLTSRLATPPPGGFGTMTEELEGMLSKARSELGPL
jgi:hypothetical protein